MLNIISLASRCQLTVVCALFLIACDSGTTVSPATTEAQQQALLDLSAGSSRSIADAGLPDSTTMYVSVGGASTIELDINTSMYDISTLYVSRSPASGYTVVNGSAVRYQHYPNQGRNDSFSYRVSDYNGNNSSPIVVNVVVGGSGPVVSSAQNTSADLNVPVGGSGTIVLDADTTVYNVNTLYVSSPTQNGYTVVDRNTVRYQHYPNQGRTDSFSYRVFDNNGNNSAPITVTISIGGASLPVASGSSSNNDTDVDNSNTNNGWWKPKASENLKWQLQLQGDIRLINGVDVYAADLTASQASINAAKATGAKLKCYISAGSAENWRADYSDIPASVRGNAYFGWPGEWWLNTRNINALAPVMRSRMDECKRMGFDAIDADNVNGYENNTGFNLSRADSINYIRWLANEAHQRGMAFSLKNSESLIDAVIDSVDMLQTESCYVYGNCLNASKISARNKAVFAVEYQENMGSGTFNQAVCPTVSGYRFSMIYRNRNLTPTGVYQSCN